jgi:hypothetical protein
MIGKFGEEGGSRVDTSKGEKGEEDLPLIGIDGKGRRSRVSLFSFAPIYACIKSY